ncbi:unnamed protein product [Didymodactylos carnosus]|uniref:Transposase Helix-turn-helix domain-containing protein n=1 Tax=Didymodactylos carnosus TaxID=1234261 RepID=A0A814WZ43_9BILA|nr:unnamed protein product [Didymodactylos carnosus]CAF1208501.1 unnamed protein product [Didymodactylos carnosus]CAF3619857.1 unnamed protein product [Didymodactylos carnosus]CAF3972640.1 unnamed protein product [Didymodactylos carnosus]
MLVSMRASNEPSPVRLSKSGLQLPYQWTPRQLLPWQRPPCLPLDIAPVAIVIAAQSFSRLSKPDITQLASIIRSPCQNVFIYFTMMFRGICQRFASVLFGISQTRISQIFHEVIDQMVQHFVPLHIGPTAFTSDDIMQNHTPKWATLLLPQAIGMIDSTYIYVQKS